MRGLFVRGGIAFVATMFAVLAGVFVQSVDTFKPYTWLVAVWVSFLLPIGVGLYLTLKREDDPKLGPAIGAFFALPAYVFFAKHPAREEGELFVQYVLSAAPMFALAGLLAGTILEKIPRVTIGLAGVMTLLVALALLVPSLPSRWVRGNASRPRTSDVPAMTLAGVLVVDGAPITAHGVTYRMQHGGFDQSYCEVVADSRAPQISTRESVLYSCRSRALRCDDTRRMCLVEDDDYATGYTYDYERIGIHGFREPDGRGGIRAEAWILALVAMFMLHRARTSPLRHALAMNALVSSSVGLSLMLRYIDPLT